jgi:hypothetical protein
VNEQFPPEIEEKRKKLYPIMFLYVCFYLICTSCTMCKWFERINELELELELDLSTAEQNF